jgi:hypothetical protein
MSLLLGRVYDASGALGGLGTGGASRDVCGLLGGAGGGGGALPGAGGTGGAGGGGVGAFAAGVSAVHDAPHHAVPTCSSGTTIMAAM